MTHPSRDTHAPERTSLYRHVSHRYEPSLLTKILLHVQHEVVETIPRLFLLTHDDEVAVTGGCAEVVHESNGRLGLARVESTRTVSGADPGTLPRLMTYQGAYVHVQYVTSARTPGPSIPPLTHPHQRAYQSISVQY